MQTLIHFFKYNNAFTIILGVVFLGTTATFAADPEVRQAVSGAVISKTETIRSVDNTKLLQTNLDAFDPSARITHIAEDENAYYVDYAYQTLAIVDAVWREVEETGSFTISKKELGDTDLGVFVADELGEVVETRLSVLAETKAQAERSGPTKKTATVAYSGLVGKLLNEKEKTFEGYERVVEEKEVQKNTNEQNGSTGQANKTPSSAESNKTQQNTNTQNNKTKQNAQPRRTSSSSGAPTIEIMGNNPARIDVGARYADLGALVTDDKDDNLGIDVSVNGKEVRYVSIDTSTSTTYEITYSATDNDGNTGTATRTVIVGSGKSEARNPKSETDTTDTATTTDEASDDESAETSPEVSAEETGTGEDSSDDTDTASSTPEE